MLGELATLLVDPARFFEDRVDPEEVRGPLLAVGAVVLVGVLGAIVPLAVQAVRLPSEFVPFLLVGGAVTVMLRAVMPVLVWLAYAGVFFVATVLLDGEGDPRELVLLSGYGMAPRALAIAVVSAAALVANLSTPVPAGMEGVQEYGARVSGHPANVAAVLFKLLAFAWSGFIWVHAVERARNVSRGAAAVAVAVPLTGEVLLTLVLLAFTLVG